MNSRSSRREAWGAACVVSICLAASWACSPEQSRAAPQDSAEPRPTPAPPFSSFDGASRSEVLAYARSLTFDTTYGAADEQRLVTDPLCDSTRAVQAHDARSRVPGLGGIRKAVGKLPHPSLLMACSVGPRVRVEPEIGAYRIGRAVVATGRIIARVMNVDSIPYPKLNLQSFGTTYWWVDSAGAGGYRSIYVPADSTKPTLQDTLRYHREPDQRWRQSLARFLVVERDDKLWTACDSQGCCRSAP
jgi:hypothetical protein